MRPKSRRPHHHPKQHTEEELKLIRDMRRRNPNLGVVTLWHRLRKRGYRSRHITEAGTLVKSCKSYPMFLGRELNAIRAFERKDDAFGFSRIRGAAYRKYFMPTFDDALLYTIPCNDEEYICMDWFADKSRRLGLSLSYIKQCKCFFRIGRA